MSSFATFTQDQLHQDVSLQKAKVENLYLLLCIKKLKKKKKNYKLLNITYYNLYNYIIITNK